MMLETGVVGTGSYLALILVVLVVAHPAIRGKDLRRAPPALAAAAAALSFAIANLLFDVIAFPHAPYLFAFIAGLAVVCGSEERARRRQAASPAVPPTKRLDRWAVSAT
jgi:hypothetical protein